MTDRGGIFSGDDPFELSRQWLAEATNTEMNDPDAMALATVDETGLPNVRIVLLKEIEADGLVFYTNYESVKGRELDSAGKGAIVIHWKSLRRQIRARGMVERVDAAQSDAYFQSRPLDSRIGAWASHQSRHLDSRDQLAQAVEDLRTELGEDPARPPHWGGYRLIPTEMEFWADGAFRLHDRFRWTRTSTENTWTTERLFP